MNVFTLQSFDAEPNKAFSLKEGLLAMSLRKPPKSVTSSFHSFKMKT